jgi:predicted dehydrogenase
MNPSCPLRFAVIGVGHLGRHHARILSAMAGAELTGVVDVLGDRALNVAAEFGTRAFAGPGELPAVDAVVVAVPTEAHGDVASRFLRGGVHVLVEKPIARTLTEADRMIESAAAGRAVLAVGHTERFNPAVSAAIAHISRPGFVEIHRLGVFPERSLDIDVVYDLMIHDLDVLLATVDERVVSLEAVGVPVLTHRVDIANARLKFSSGCIANLTASRISRERVRKVRFFQPNSYLSIDYASQEVERYELRTDGAGPAIQGGKLEVARGEPLRLELEDFADAIRSGRRPRVTAEDGRRALELARRISDAIDEGRSATT